MYRFKYGRFAGKAMEQVMLRDAPGLYERAAWAKREKLHPKLLLHFNLLRKRLKRARIVKRCHAHSCKKRARWMTLPLDYERGWLPAPYYWCDKHSPWVEEGISPKLPVHFDAVRHFSDKQDQQEICKQVKLALGIKTVRITEKFARWFFGENLRKD